MRDKRSCYSWQYWGPPVHHMFCSADADKVQALIESIKDIGLQEPVCALRNLASPICSGSIPLNAFDTPFCMQIDVLFVEGKYYGFSGCHRYEV